MLFLSFNCRRRRRGLSICFVVALIQLISLIDFSNAEERLGRVSQVFLPAAPQSLDDENAAQLDALDARLRAEMRVTAAPTLNYGYYPYNLAFPSVPFVPFTTTSTQNSLWNQLGHTAPFAVTYGASTRNANTPLNFDMLENRKKISRSNAKIVDADVQGSQFAGPLIGSNTIGEALPVTVAAKEKGDAPTGENIFVDALKQVLVLFKRGMMSRKYGSELQHKAESLNQDIKSHTPLPNRLVDSVGSRPYLALSRKWEANAVDGRFSGARAVDAAKSEFRRKPAAIKQLYPTYTMLPSRLTN